MDKTKVNKWLGYLKAQNTNKKGVLTGMLDECTFSWENTTKKYLEYVKSI